MKETEIAAEVVSWLEEQHWEVYQEVKFRGYGGIADIVAVNGNLLWIVEVKRSLSLSVMAQAAYWRSHFRSVAVPATKRAARLERGLAYKISKDYLRIGIITVDGSYVSQPIPPPIMREYHKFAKEKMERLVPEHKHYAKAGQRGGYWTPYKSTIQACRRYIRSHPGCTFKEMMDGISHHYANDKSAIGALRRNFRDIESNWVRIDDSVHPFRLYIREEK